MAKTKILAVIIAYTGLLCGCGMHSLPNSGVTNNSDVPAFISGIDWAQPRAHHRLPKALREISGIVSLTGTKILAHDDNVSMLWLLDSLGTPGPRPVTLADQNVRGDFEDLTLIQGDAYLMDSHGALLRVRLPTDLGTGADIAGPFERVGNAGDGRCNFEGLAARPLTADFIFACKYLKYPGGADIHLYRQANESAGMESEPWIVDDASIRQALRIPRLRPSALHWLADERHLLILAGKERVLLEVDEEGKLLAWQRLRQDLHRQAEGLTVDHAGNIIIADEADGRVATLTVYGRTPASSSLQ